MNGQKLEEVTSFKYLGATLCKDGTCSAEVQIGIASAMARLMNRSWLVNTISFTCKLKLYKSLVTSILLCGCKTWTLLADSEKRIPAFETKSIRKLPCINYLEHKTNDWVWSKINFLVGPQEPPLWQLSRDRNLHGSGMSHAMTASPNPSFRTPQRIGNAMVGRGNAGWTTSKSGHPCQNCSEGPPAEKTGRDDFC